MTATLGRSRLRNLQDTRRETGNVDDGQAARCLGRFVGVETVPGVSFETITPSPEDLSSHLTFTWTQPSAKQAASKFIHAMLARLVAPSPAMQCCVGLHVGLHGWRRLGQ